MSDLKEEDRNEQQYFKAAEVIHALKSMPRRGWLLKGIENPESVAAHSFGTAVLAYLLAPPDMDRELILKLALFHDVAEAGAGDITPHDGPAYLRKTDKEREFLINLIGNAGESEKGISPEEKFSDNVSTGFTSFLYYWKIYEHAEIPEALFVRQVDILDRLLQALYYSRKFPEKKESLKEFFKDLKHITHPALIPVRDAIENEVENMRT